MREIDPDELRATTSEGFVRWHLRPGAVTRAWVDEGATVVEAVGERSTVPADSRVLTALGRPEPLTALLEAVAEVVPAPDRLTVPVEEADQAPWRHAEHRHWYWLYADRPVPPPRVPVAEVTAADDI